MSDPADIGPHNWQAAKPIFSNEQTTIYERTTITEVMHLEDLFPDSPKLHTTKGVQRETEQTSADRDGFPSLTVTGLAPFKSSGQSDLEITDSLGVGGMGTVYLANQTSMMREVALKRSHRPSGDGPSYDSVRAESLLFGSLDHPNIPPVHVVGNDASGHAMLVMKRIDGSDLHSMLKSPQHSRWADVDGDHLDWMLDIFNQVCHAVEHAHSRNVLHRDIKSENIMVCDFGQVFLIDWGIAVDMTSPEAITKGKFIGTPCFAAPEMLTKNVRLDRRTDVYLLGAMLLEMTGGSVLFRGRSLKEIMKRVRSNEREAIPSTVPKALATIIAQATAHDPNERFASVKALQSAVRKYKTDRYFYSNISRAEEQMATLEVWLGDSKTDTRTAYRFMTMAHEALALLKAALQNGVAVEHVRTMLAQNVTLQARYAILTEQFGVANALVAELSLQVGETSPWVTTLAAEIAAAKHAYKAKRSEIQVETNVRMIEKLKQLEDSLIDSGQSRKTVEACLSTPFIED